MNLSTAFKAQGFAEVMVVLKDKSNSKNVAAQANVVVPTTLLRHFQNFEGSQDYAILEVLKQRTAQSMTKKKESRAGVTIPSAAKVNSNELKSPNVYFYSNLGLMIGSVSRAGLAALRKEPTVEKVTEAPEFRLIKPVQVSAAQPTAGYTWGLKAIGIDRLHSDGLTGRGVLVGHLDTGVDGSHPALAGVIGKYAEFDSLGIQVTGAQPKDSGEHGTHTACTIAGQAIKGIHIGVAPGAKLASAMVIEGGKVTARVLGGMNWVVGQGARVLSMSLGFPGYAEDFAVIVQTLRERGVLPVIAVGNDGPGRSRYPGNYSEAVSVGAMDESFSVPDFSSSQRFARSIEPFVPDLVAPGVDVISGVPGGGYIMMSGSSMATPHIAGLAALLMEAKPNKTIEEIEAAIFQSCQLKPWMLKTRVNRGLPNAQKALALL
jgi:subtilisin family serine protease